MRVTNDVTTYKRARRRTETREQSTEREERALARRHIDWRRYAVQSPAISITSIGDFAFESCFSLVVPKLPDGARVGDQAFDRCKRTRMCVVQ